MKILVIEDNDSLRKSVFDYLSEEGFVVDLAADGTEGLYKANNWAYGAIVLDVMIPVPDGFAVLRQLRATGNVIPVILLTARGSLSDRLQGLDGGADDYLVKPFAMAELVARIRAAIRRSANAPNPVIQIGALRFNTAVRSVELHERPVELTAREYALLETLVMQRNKVVSRGELYEQICDEKDESMSNMLDVYIYKLRQKFGKSWIETRRSMGYQFNVKAVVQGK